MVLEETGLTVEQVMSVRDRPLTESYEVHDVGMEFIVRRLEMAGFHVEDHGDDARHAADVLYGDGPDLAVYDEPDGELCCYIEVKTKENPTWFGRCNLRHFKEYITFSNDVSVPLFIWFALVECPDDDDEDPLLKRDAFVEVTDTDQIDGDVVNVTEESSLVVKEDDIEETDIDGATEDTYCEIDASDVIGIRKRDTLVGYYPNIHGNDVIELNDDEFRSWPHIQYRLGDV